MATTAQEYLVLLVGKGKSLKPLKQQFDALGGFYNGIGYAFPSSSEESVSQIAQSLGSKIVKLPLAAGQTFEMLQQSQKAVFFKDRLIQAEKTLVSLLSELGIDEPSEEAILAQEPSAKREEAAELFRECERLRESIHWASKLEKAMQPAEPTQLRFISEIASNYFLKPPPEKPKLLYFVEKDGVKTTFLHKEITAMLVGEGGRGKTHLLALLAASVASGIPLLGQIEIEQPGAAALILGENNPEDIHRLLFKTYRHLEKILKNNRERKDGKHFGLHSDNPLSMIASRLMPISVHGVNAHFIGERGETTPFYTRLLEQLKLKEPKEGFQLIILDPASRFAGPDAEKDNAIATSFIASLERISDQLKGRPAILLSHHKSKTAIRDNGGTQADARGSSGLTDGVRWQANLSRGESNEHSILEVTKTNFTSYPKKIILKKGKDGMPEWIQWEEKPEPPGYNLSRFKEGV